jgi:hypothetical protein
MYANIDDQYAMEIDKILNEHGSDLSGCWIDFVNKFLPEEVILKNINNDKLNDYIYNFFNRKNPL